MGEQMAVQTGRRWTRLAMFVTPAVVFLLVLALATTRSGGAPGPGDPAPAFEASRLGEAGTLSLADIHGRPLVLNFWASWCAPCRDEAEILEKAYDTFGGDIAFVGVDIRDAVSDALAFQKEFDVSYPSVRDEDQSIYSDYGLTGQPETFFIDADGTVVEHVAGPLSEEQLFQILDVLVSRDG
jgi:cytochrome c biogenesis protein CcmG, thiol:disulfide interchange protein DsbE